MERPVVVCSHKITGLLKGPPFSFSPPLYYIFIKKEDYFSMKIHIHER